MNIYVPLCVTTLIKVVFQFSNDPPIDSAYPTVEKSELDQVQWELTIKFVDQNVVNASMHSGWEDIIRVG